MDGRSALARLESGTPVRGAGGPSALTAPSDTAVLDGLIEAAFSGCFPPPPLQAAEVSETTPRTTRAIRLRIT